MTEDTEYQLDMFQENRRTFQNKPTKKPTAQQLAAVIGLDYDSSKIRPYTVVRINPTTVCTLHD